MKDDSKQIFISAQILILITRAILVEEEEMVFRLGAYYPEGLF